MVQEDLTIFGRNNGSLFVQDPKDSSDIETRMAMRGVVVEGHFDARCNMAAVVTGTRRWILAQPRNCPHAYLLPSEHPSARHSKVDWAQPDLDSYPDFANMRAHEVILLAGEILYIPMWWLHYVVVLEVSAQCNLHNGRKPVGTEHIEACGFADVVARNL